MASVPWNADAADNWYVNHPALERWCNLLKCCCWPMVEGNSLPELLARPFWSVEERHAAASHRVRNVARTRTMSRVAHHPATGAFSM
eukprot:CAMPEP_0174717120 /NCGR_PEP_ID=MMETSP1094-20130205/25929_1 /TAXON_ID=156173 /ORGANISM="Chrysochromulina brevifilum, Strain UTEX LB 985" /LENGTH=86 /DNA_ID=CAMNT_0015917013 /DNA_START=572 /DNA_END=832 /DNA_ORIENTATION=-